jgi:hypothetical protein
MDATLAAWLPLEVLHDVCDIDAIAREADRVERAIEHTAGGSDEGLTRKILRITRLLADEHHDGFGATFTEYRLRRATPEVASAAIGRSEASRSQRRLRRDEWRRRERRRPRWSFRHRSDEIRVQRHRQWQASCHLLYRAPAKGVVGPAEALQS